MRRAVLAATLVVAAAAAQRARPNIVFVFSDDHACRAISAYGATWNTTPNIDRLAVEGALFRNNFCGNSICGPSRATVLTGLHSHANGFRQNGDRFDPAQTTFPKLLQRAGYATAMLGKWHLASDPQGFDHWEVLPGQGQYYNPDLRSATGSRRIEGHSTEVVTELALEWLAARQDDDRPFLLMCQYKAPHRPWLPAPAQLGLYRDADLEPPATLFDDHSGRSPASLHHAMGIATDLTWAYDLQVPRAADERLRDSYDATLRRMTATQRAAFDAAFAADNAALLESAPEGRDLVLWKWRRYLQNYLRCVAGVDAGVGRILDWLDANGLAKDTVVVYASDQGFYLGEHGWFDKRWIYEESMRMPLLVRWPGRIAPGTEVTALTQNIDFAPTLLDIAGVDVPDTMHGVSMLPLLGGEVPDGWRDSLYYHYYEAGGEHQVPAHVGVRTARHKLVHFYTAGDDAFELFDLERDPQELQSLHADPAHATLLAELRDELAALERRYAVPARPALRK